MKTSDITIIGAGIVGLATAYTILKKNPNIRLLIIEKENEVAKHQTGNNSGVIHSGIYYKPGSLKAINCRRGYQMLLDFCDDNNIEYDICGKVIVAASEKELPALENIFNRGIENGLDGIKYLSEVQLKEREPHVNGIKGIFVPQTGIIDFKTVSEKLAESIRKKGGEIVFNTSLQKIINTHDVIIVETNSGEYHSKFVITCAGLQSDRIARMTKPDLDVRIIPFRGEYYKLKDSSKTLVNNLIYPVPDPAFPFLGVHFTRMINGDVECGPNAVFSFKREGYSKLSFNFRDTIDSLSWRGFHKVALNYWKMGLGEFYRSFNKNAFVRALQKLIPEIKESDLIKGGAGVRAQACDKNGKLIDDFYFVEQENLIHVCNAPSPAATSALSIGEYISDKYFKQVA
ncbi:l-2-hydroxyglutarate oxidase [hydrocarbon metagenome]|uniref:L-2-hydroxyglutarate oxidase n=1 Tax=hydrocarbon metagenome TaxID=938273 RepID=A0A0W8FWC1_9ZZZZ